MWIAPPIANLGGTIFTASTYTNVRIVERIVNRQQKEEISISILTPHKTISFHGDAARY